MRYLVLASFMPLVLLAGDLEYKGNIGFEAQYIDHDIANKRDNALALRLEAELKKEIGDGTFAAKIKGLMDKDDKERRYVDFSDLYYKYDFEDSDILIGRNIRFWGALEFYNLTDVFNTKDFLDDPFDYDSKLGAWNTAFTKYFDSSEISLIVKLYEEKQKMQDRESVNNFFPLPYDDDLKTQHDKNRPSVFLKYSGFGDEVQIDYGLIYQNGYDSQRYMSVENGVLRQNAYIVNKLMGYATYIHGDTIYKTELSYALSDDEKISDYSELGVGLEHTLYGFWDKRDLGLLVEYYRYDEKDDDKVDFNKIFADDLTFGFRLSMNDLSSSEVLGGFDYDLDTKEKIFFVQYDTRVLEKYKLKTSYQHLEPEKESVFKRLDRVKLEFGYYF
jgi:hypothetical protein